MKGLLYFLLLVLAGCYSSEYISYNNGIKYPPTSTCEVIADLSKCQYEYEVFGMIQVKAETWFTDLEGAHEKLIAEAKENGADAVSPISTGATGTFYGGSYDYISAKLIRYKRNTELVPIKQKD